MSKRRTKIPTPTWEHEQTGITRKLDANRWQIWATAGILVLVFASLGVIGGRIDGSARASNVLPLPGGPDIKRLCAPAAATSMARFACSCPRTSAKSTG